MTTTRTQPERLLYTVVDAMAMTSLSRTLIYELIRSGRLASVTQGRRRLIPADALIAYVQTLRSEAGL